MGTIWVIGVGPTTFRRCPSGSAQHVPRGVRRSGARWTTCRISRQYRRSSTESSDSPCCPRLLRSRPDRAAGLTLGLLVLPIVVSIRAMKAIPDTIRQGAYALQHALADVRRQVLRHPGNRDRHDSRALARNRRGGAAGVDWWSDLHPPSTRKCLDSAFTVLPIQIFNWVSRPQEEFKVLAAAAISW